jgi:hypothetical protein
MTVGGPLHELEGKGATDAVAHEKELPDAEVVHQPELVLREGTPGVVDRDRPTRLAAVGVALIHRDAAKVVLERFHGVEHSGGPIADAGVQAPTGGDQQWEAGAGLLVADADVALVVKRHGSLSLQGCERRPISEAILQRENSISASTLSIVLAILGSLVQKQGTFLAMRQCPLSLRERELWHAPRGSVVVH